ncbi:MAG TPA: DivIVA domain-containing protein [Acidimicrobiales bacterium]|jgi:cell division initiation protein|nr:DivIVA domain-containing protein [Acidimicrobiales bacterium]
MDSPKSSSQQSSLDSLRTVEFRQTLRGYHIDDVDEYLERVAIEAEALQEQMRQSADRMRQAAERIAQLEQSMQQLEQQLVQVQSQPSSPAPATAPDDALQRTLLLAQKFVDQTEAEAEAQARSTLAEAEARAHTVLADAENRSRALTEETERKLREDISRLESIRTQLAGDVETIARHLDTERNRLRAALGDMLTWVDEHVQPAASLLAQQPSAPPPPPPFSSGSSPASGSSPEATPPASAEPNGETHGPAGGQPPAGQRPMPTGQAGPGGPATPTGSRGPDADEPASSGERQGTMPLSDPEGARAGVPR